MDQTQNPSQIQPGPGSSDPVIPLILFHDAGGTVFPYFCLGDIKRPLFGVKNPRFEQGGRWEHGLRQMGVVYTHLVRSAVPSGKVILGGWSLGGCIAVEVASRLMKLPQYTVQGVVLVDSVYPTPVVTTHYPRTLPEVEDSFQLPAQMSDERRGQAQKCILAAHEMQRDWRPPAFSESPPPAVLIKAADRVHENSEHALHYFDRVRDWAYLGWEDYDTSFIVATMNTPGNHFTIFDGPNAENTTEKIREACFLLAESHE